MDIRREPSIQEVKDFEIHNSWVPITPVKPVQPKPQQICAERQENQLGSENWFVPERFSTGFAQETQAQTNYVETNKGFNNWEASLTASHIFSEFSMDLDRLKNVPFANLMALADAGVTRQGNVNATSTHFNPIFNSQFEGHQFETSSANSSPAKPDLSFGSTQWNISSCAQNTPLHGYSIASRPAYDLNSQPAALTDAFSSRIISSQFAPITPDQSKKAENKQACDINQSNVDERTNQVRDTQGNEVATTRAEVEELCHEKEQQQLTNDMSIAAISTQLQENHNPDIELNRTQQKPRRRKHRPKVVIEGQPKRTRKTAAPKSANPKENPPAKRKYVRKNGLNKTQGTPTVEVASGSPDPKTVPCTEKSCRRKLDFDFKSQVSEESSSCRPQSNGNAESQAENFYTTVESKSTVQLGQGMEAMVKKTQVGITYDLKHFQNKVLQDNMSVPERQSRSPPNPTKTDPPHEKLKAHAQIEQTRGKCQIVFSDETHDKQGSTIQMVINTESQSATKTPNDSECCSSGCLTGEGERGIKRGHSCTIDEGETSYTNMIGVHYNYLHQYLATFPANLYNKILIPGMHFPAIHKKNRAENGQGSTPSSTLSTVTAANYGARQATHCLKNCAYAASYTSETNCRCSAAQFNTGSTSTRTASVTDAQGKQESFECNLPSDQTGRMTKKRCKGPTQGHNLASVIGIVEYKQLPTFPAGGAPVCGDMQLYGISNHPHTCMESQVTNTRATMKTKKRAKRNSCASSRINDATSKRIPTIDAVVDYLKWLDINLESNQVKYLEQDPYKLRYEEQKALVLYKRDGTVVPFEGSFGQVRKRRPRPKVDLDEETTKVWKLLLENINSEGVDGTDAEKAKWWEEERQVFRGRADSFIARMHLVQGDRRFSPWKGSVLDSVIGVFLTQNVSDHLSSSAFMSLAARFPLQSKSTDMPRFEDTSTLVKEPEIFIEEPDDTIKWYEEKSNQPACNTITTTLHDVDCSIEKEVNSNELQGSSSGCVKPTDNMKCTSSDICGNGLELYHESTANIVIQHSDAVACLGRDKREVDDVLSSQDSASSSQNFVDSSMAQTTERTGSFSIDNSEVDPATRPNANGLVGSSFLELLQRATIHGLYNKETGNVSAYKGNEHTYMHGLESDTQKHNKEGSNNPKTSFRPIISSSNYCSQMTPDSGVQGFEFFEMLDEEKLFSDFSKKSEENCTSEQSGVTAESVSQTMVQIMNASFQEEPRSPSENNHACSSFQGEANKIFQSQNGPVGTPRNNIQSETGEQNHGMQQVLEVPNHSKETLHIAESTGMVNNQKNAEHKAVEGKAINGTSIDTPTIKRGRIGKQKENVDWDNLRLQAQTKGKRERTVNTLDSLDWEAVRCADVNLIADTIKERGMNNMLAERIKDFLNRLVREHESTDLEWLRDVPPDKAKEYLLSVRGLGLKSVECVRLLTLHHLAFPVDTNVGRIAVRLGWVPLQPLPESLQLHLLELYPVLESIQRYLWPRLCKLDQRTLYELHYQMITFGKVFCTKSKPNCNACPMRGECRHFASAFASARLALPGPEEKSIVAATENKAASQNPIEVIKPLQLPQPHANQQLQAQYQTNNCEPIIEEPRTPEPIVEVPATPGPIVEVPATPGPELPKVTDSDIEDMFCEDPEEIPTIKLNIKELTQNLQNYMEQNMVLQEGDVSKALVALTSEAASIPMPKLKNVNQLRTEHRVYELPDSHPLLEGLDKREPDDPCSYLLAIWTPGETADSIQPPERQCSSQVSGMLCDEKTCFSCNSIREANSQTVRGTLLIPCRTAMRGSFPLNGTYFQVNEVFADHESSINPIAVPRDWIWNLRRRTVYFGTSIPTIFKGLSTESIQQCFWRGFVCVRGFDQKTRAPRPLLARLHFPASKLTRTKGKTDDQQV